MSTDGNHFGFMPENGMTDGIFIVQQLQEKCLVKKKALFYKIGVQDWVKWRKLV